MMQEAKKYKVSILGETYSLISDEPEKLVNETVEFINETIQEITSKSSGLQDTKIMAFALIKAALKRSLINFELETLKESINKMESFLDQSALL